MWCWQVVLSSASSARGSPWSLLGHRIGVKCLSRLLGQSTNYVYRALVQQPDLRTKGVRAAPPSKLRTHLDAFLMTTYLSVAEPLPDRRAASIMTPSQPPGKPP